MFVRFVLVDDIIESTDARLSASETIRGRKRSGTALSGMATLRLPCDRDGDAGAGDACRGALYSDCLGVVAPPRSESDEVAPAPSAVWKLS
jgi:hypothetical protein